MKQKKFLKVATLGILTTLMLGVSSYVSAASGHAYCAGYSGNDLGTTSMTTNAYNTYRSLGYSSNYTISPSFNTLKSGKFSVLCLPQTGGEIPAGAISLIRKKLNEKI